MSGCNDELMAMSSAILSDHWPLGTVTFCDSLVPFVLPSFTLHSSILPPQHRLARGLDFVGPADRRRVRGLVEQFGRFLDDLAKASAKASSVALLSVSVGSIIIASRTISGK